MAKHLFLSFFKKSFKFKGRTSPSVYWMTHLVLWGLEFTLNLFGTLFPFIEKVAFVWVLILIIPSASMMIRRLHDTNRSAWHLLYFFIPIFGQIALLIFLIRSGDSKANKYGPEPEKLSF
ncbi:DUF805 domain-containing protein [Lacticigenium naphthae]|uniref:DUF805 domain-containing protein n=1 Tax=Lacticigenium naphthae TaxID=515351 RepID=UPI0003F5730A|nr:DUF805 domain-containing protein [Lacticigenium naphthae]